MRRMIHPFLFAGLMAVGLGACGRDSDQLVDVVLVGDWSPGEGPDGDSPFDLTGAPDPMIAAARERIVDFDSEGRISPGLAESWIVTADGLSYIFRLREMKDADGTAIPASVIAKNLRQRIEAQSGTALGLDLSIIDAIYARTGRVIEIRLLSPMPEFLNLLAGSELAIKTDAVDPHALIAERSGQSITFLPQPLAEGQSASEWNTAEPLDVQVMDGRAAVDYFQQGKARVLFGGNIDALPDVELGGLLRGTIRLDPVSGLFGLRVSRADGFLSESSNREALAMAIDRNALIQPFQIGGWVPTTRQVPANMIDSDAPPTERWSNVDHAQLQQVARARVAGWRAANGDALALTVALPAGEGGRIIFDRLNRDFSAIGIGLSRVAGGEPADLELVDEVANYRMARWYLNRLACPVSRAACSQEADALIREAMREPDEANRRALMTEAEALIVAQNGFIPFGQPIRFSLVRGSVNGFAVNALGVHPLPPLAFDPN